MIKASEFCALSSMSEPHSTYVELSNREVSFLRIYITPKCLVSRFDKNIISIGDNDTNEDEHLYSSFSLYKQIC